MQEALRLKEAQKHVFFHHNSGTDGYITIAKKDAISGKFKQWSYKPEELSKNLSKWMGEDIYFSQNTFYKPQRRIENIRQLKSLYVDLDFYIWNYDPSWIMGKLEHEYYGECIPEPNLIIFSGQGIVLVWLIEPVPHQALPLWQAVQNFFLKQLESLGGDPKSNEAARVFRIAGTTTSKNGETVHVQYRNEYRYELRQLQFEYLPELTPKKKPDKPKPGRKKQVVHLYNIYTLNHARLLDLVKLVELREYDVEGYRETICFLYRYWLCCYTNDTETAIEQTLELNSMFVSPLSKKEVIRATQSAEKAYTAKSNQKADAIAKGKGYPGAGYNISNAKLIKWLDISPDEERHMLTIISKKEKNRRSYEKVLEKRRQDGMKERSAYLSDEAQKTANNLQVLREVLEHFPKLSIRKLAETTGFSKSYVHKLKKILDAES